MPAKHNMYPMTLNEICPQCVCPKATNSINFDFGATSAARSPCVIYEIENQW